MTLLLQFTTLFFLRRCLTSQHLQNYRPYESIHKLHKITSGQLRSFFMCLYICILRLSTLNSILTKRCLTLLPQVADYAQRDYRCFWAGTHQNMMYTCFKCVYIKCCCFWTEKNYKRNTDKMWKIIWKFKIIFREIYAPKSKSLLSCLLQDSANE